MCDALRMERRLREPPLPPPQLPLAAEEAVAEEEPQPAHAAPLRVVRVVLLEDVLHVVRVQDHVRGERAEAVANEVAVREHVARMQIDALAQPERRQAPEERDPRGAGSDPSAHFVTGSRLRPAPPLRSMTGPASAVLAAITSASRSAMATKAPATLLPGAACTTGVPLSPHSRTV